MKKRLISLVTILALAIALMPQTALITSATAADWSYPESEPSEPYAGGTGTQDDPYTIETPQQLANFAYMVDNNKASSSYYKLTADIDLGGEPFPAMGYNKGRNFWGHFDGNGKTISGLKIDNPSTNYQALFYAVAASAVIENVNVKGSVSGKMDVGGIVATNNGTIKNCTFEGTVTGASANTNSQSTSSGTGGIAGHNTNGATVSNCIFRGTVSGVDYVGGILGYNLGTVSECSNKGSVNASSTGTSYIGGIAGYNGAQYKSMKQITGTIENCSNSGAVTASGGYAGGVTGYNAKSNPAYATVKNCYNTGAVSGTRSVGGIAGQNDGYLNYCYNTGKVTMTSGSYGGGIIGNYGTTNSYSTYVKNCYYLEGTYTGGIAGNDYNGSAEKITATQMAAQGSFVDWNFTDIWVMDKTMPVLQWEQTQKSKETPEVTAPTGKTNLVYTAEAQELLASAAATTGGTFQYKVDDGEYGTSLPSAINAGDHTVFYKVAGDDNYEDVEEVSIIVNIKKADQTVPKPSAAEIKPLSVTLTALDGGVNGVKYAVSETDTAPADADKWQDSVTFTDLTKATTYYFFAKYLGDDNHNEAVSEGAEITTAEHTHEWEYTVSGTTITAECKNTDGACSDTDGGSVTLTAPAESLVYNTESHNAAVNNTLTTGDTVTVKYEYKASVDGDYAETDTTVSAGYYKALVTLDADKMVFVEYAVNKQTVTAPTISSKAYTGAKLAADIAANEYYTVTENDGGTEKGNYDVILTLNDADNYKWSDGDENAAKTLTFTITETSNEWITEPSVTGCIYGETVTVSNGAAKFGAVKVTYTGAANDNTQYNSSEPPTKAGSYTATFTVAGTASYSGLTVNKNFEITKAEPSVNAPEGLTAIYGQTLADVALPSVLAWEDRTQSVGNAGEKSFNAVYTPGDTANYNSKIISVAITVNKQAIAVPAISNKTYTGTTLAADVTESEYYTVTENDGGTEKGNYDVILTLNDTDNYKWSDGDENAAKTLIFTITETENEWVTEPSVTGCIYGETVTVSNGAAKFGAVKVTYTGAANDNTQYSSSEPPIKAGSYTATFTVEGTASYGSLSAAKNFNIEKANQNKPSAPAASVTGTNSITLSEITGGSNGTEYAASASSEAPESGWQDSAEFTGLEEDTTYYFFARFKGNENYNASEISEGTPIKTDVREPVDVFEEIPAIGDYTDKITVQKRIKDNKAEFTVISGNDSDLSEIWLILAEYNGGVLDNVKLVKGTVSDSKIMMETDLPVLPDYKYMLWNTNQKPLIEAITKIGKVF